MFKEYFTGQHTHNNYAKHAVEIAVGPGEFECEGADNTRRAENMAPPIGSVWHTSPY